MIHDDQKMLFHRFDLQLRLVNSQSSKCGIYNRHFGKTKSALAGNKNENSNDRRNISIYVIRFCWSGFWNLSIRLKLHQQSLRRWKSIQSGWVDEPI